MYIYNTSLIYLQLYIHNTNIYIYMYNNILYLFHWKLFLYSYYYKNVSYTKSAFIKSSNKIRQSFILFSENTLIHENIFCYIIFTLKIYLQKHLYIIYHYTNNMIMYTKSFYNDLFICCVKFKLIHVNYFHSCMNACTQACTMIYIQSSIKSQKAWNIDPISVLLHRIQPHKIYIYLFSVYI